MRELSRAQLVVAALAISSFSSVFIYVIGYLYYDASILNFLNWNLLLAWVPLISVLWLKNHLKTSRLLSWKAILAILIWLAFLPNCFYLISDLMHLNRIYTENPLYFAVLLFSFSFSGLMLGLFSLYFMQRIIVKRYSEKLSIYIATTVLLYCSFAIYFGRFLRWSSWDIILNPAGVVFDVSDRFINPDAHGKTFEVTALFFVLLFSIYVTFWILASLAYQQRNKK